MGLVEGSFMKIKDCKTIDDLGQFILFQKGIIEKRDRELEFLKYRIKELEALTP